MKNVIRLSVLAAIAAVIALASMPTEVSAQAGSSFVKRFAEPVRMLSTLTVDGATTFATGDISLPELAFPRSATFLVCGDGTTVNNNTVYYGSSTALGATGVTCDTTAAGSTTEATADAPAFGARAFHVVGFHCRHDDPNATLSFTARSAVAALTPTQTCTSLDNASDCVSAAAATTTQVASGATFAVAVASTADLGTVKFVCAVTVAY